MDVAAGRAAVARRAPRVLFADDHLVVVDKPAGMPSVPARRDSDPPDVASVLAAALAPGEPRLEAAHRLDRDTSGILVLARCRAARAALGRAFEAGAVAKTYVAIVRGLPPSASGEVHLPIAADPDRPPRQRVDATIGKPAVTRWTTVAAAWPGPGSTLVSLEPLTGRSHQLRVHLAWLGCPVAGDPLYGTLRGASTGRMWLHAAAIDFPHPADGRRVLVRAPLCLDGFWCG